MLHQNDSGTVVRWALVIFVVALVLRLLFVELTTITPVSDSARYLEHAQRLLAGEGYVNRHHVLSAFTPPGYPFFLAGGLWLSGDSIHFVLLVQAVLGALCAVLTVLVGVRLFELRIAATAGILLAVSPTAIVYTGELLTEVLTTFLMFAFFWLVQGIATQQQRPDSAAVADCLRCRAAAGGGLAGTSGSTGLLRGYRNLVAVVETRGTSQ